MTGEMAAEIAGRTGIEEQLGQAQRRYEELVTTINGVVWELDVATFAFEFVSPQAEPLLGYPLSEWYETPSAWVKYLHEDDRDAAIAFCVEETRAKRDHRFEYRMVRADGRIVWLQDIVKVVVADGQPVKLRGVMVDITQQKQAEAERERLSSELTRFFDLSLDLLCVVGFDGYFKRVNLAFQETLGYGAEELLSRPIVDFIHPDDRGDAADALSRAAQGIRLGSFENRYIDRTGNSRWIQWNGRLGGDDALYAAGRDITESRLYTHEQSALRRIAMLVADDRPPEVVFESVALEANRLLEADGTALMRYEPDDSVFILAQNHLGVPGPDAGRRISLDGDSVTSRVRATGRAARMDRYEAVDGSMAELVRQLGVRRSVGAPITVENRLWGIMVCAWDVRPTPPEVEQHLSRFTELVATAIADAQSRAELAASRKRVIIAADDARRQIQRNLHDGTQQRLVSLAVELREAGAMAGENVDLSTKLERMSLTLAETLEELQDLSRGLHPALLARGGLQPALRALSARSTVPVDLSVELAGRLPESLEIAAYYIVSEAFTNAAKHANASGISVTISARDGALTLAVHDDGVGGAEPARGSGLTGLRDRVEALGGTLAITSPTDGGTRLDVRLALPPPDLNR